MHEGGTFMGIAVTLFLALLAALWRTAVTATSLEKSLEHQRQDADRLTKAVERVESVLDQFPAFVQRIITLENALSKVASEFPRRLSVLTERLVIVESKFGSHDRFRARLESQHDVGEAIKSLKKEDEK